MKKYTTGKKMTNTIQQLYAKASSAVLVPGTAGDWVHTSVGVHHHCFLSLTLFKLFLECIVTDAQDGHLVPSALEKYQPKSLIFADDIGGLAGS